MSSPTDLLGGVELGGTKCVCIVGTGPDDIRALRQVPTGRDPEATLRQIEAVFAEWRSDLGPVAALGVASFGPVDLNRDSPNWGYITSTGKPGWRDTDIAPRLARRLGVAVGFDTDVNGAALAEHRWGAARGIDDFAYVTVGTGIGVGLMVGGRLGFGFTHPELGHIRVARKHGDSWGGSCAFHGDCVEGLASGSAVASRVGESGDRLPPDHPVWDLVAHPLGQLLHVLVLATAPRRILIGGGVMNAQAHLFARVKRELQDSLNHYVVAPEIGSAIEDYVVSPALGDRAGPLGALAIAAQIRGGG